MTHAGFPKNLIQNVHILDFAVCNTAKRSRQTDTRARFKNHLTARSLFPQGLKPGFYTARNGAAEAAPLQRIICRVENRRSGVSLPVAVWLRLSLRRRNPAWLGSVACPRSSNRTGGFPASGSRKRLTFSPTEGLPSVSVNRPIQTRCGELFPENV